MPDGGTQDFAEIGTILRNHLCQTPCYQLVNCFRQVAVPPELICYYGSMACSGKL